jgi:hypothetical protein
MNSQGLRRSPRLAELAAKKSEKKAVQVSLPKAQNPPPKATDTSVLTKESLSYLRMRAAFMGALYKNMLPEYKKAVSMICWTIDMLWEKTDEISVAYREHLYDSLKDAVDGYMFFDPVTIASVKKNGSSIDETAKGLSEVMNANCTRKYSTNLKGYITIIEYMLDSPILISQRPKLRRNLLGRVKYLEESAERFEGKKKMMAEQVIKKAYAVLTLLPLRDDFRL